MIHDVLRKGKTQAISAEEVALLCGLPSKRAVVEQVAKERIDGHIICSTRKGYFLPETREELQEFVDLMEGRAKKTFAVIKKARHLLKELS